MLELPEELDYSAVDAAYDDQWDLIADLNRVLDLRIYLYYKYHAWVGPENNLSNMMGFVVTRQEFEYNLSKGTQIAAFASVTEEEAEDIRNAELLVKTRIARSDASKFPLLQLARRLGLDGFEFSCVALAFILKLDKKYEKIIAYLQDDITSRLPKFELVCQLLSEPGDVVACNLARFKRKGLFSSLFNGEHWARGELSLSHYVEEFILGMAPQLEAGMELFSPDAPLDELLIRQELAGLLRKMVGSGGRGLTVLKGPEGAGKRFLLKHAMRAQGKTCLFADVRPMAEDVQQGVCRAMMLAALTGSSLCLYHVEAVLTGEQATLSAFEQALSDAPESLGVIFLLTEETYRASGLSDRFIISAFELDMPDEAERARLFTGYMKKFRPEPELSIKELAVKFHFVPGQIKNAVRQAEGLTELGGASEITAETMHRCCYNQVVHKLDSLAARITPAYGWDDLILPPDQIKLMQQACDHIRYSMRVFNEWGFGRRVTYGRGLSMLFAGPPGTGKTMGAQVVANQLHMELYRVQISQVISKYIGETEKNLRAVFQEAKRSNCILFFDECDAIFGKRSEVKDAHDRYANVETAYLLQQVEEFDGVCILATNLLQNIDAAFMRRISFVIHFPFPDKETRAKLYKSMLLPDVPVADNVDFDFMAEKFEITGGSIKNIVVNAAFLAAAKDAPIGMEELLVAAVNELRKNEIVVVRKDLGEYADLVFK